MSASTAPARRAARSVRRASSTDVPLIATAALIGALLAAYELGTRSLWLDEAASVSIASQHGAALWHAIARDGGNMLAYYLLLHVLIGACGDGQVIIRLTSALATGATAALVAALGLRLFDRRIAISAALLTAVSLPLVYWGQNARSYALMVTFVVASFVAFTELVRRDELRWTLPVAYAISTLLAIYMGLIAVVIIPAQLAALVLARRRARAVIASLAAVAAGCVPLVVLALRRGSGQLFWVPAPTLRVLGQTARTLTSAGMPPNFHTTATGTLTLVLIGALLLAASAASAPAIRPALRTRAIGRDWGVLLVLAWWLVPSVLGLLASRAGEPVELARSTVLLLPAVALLLAWALHHPRLPAAIGFSGLAIVLLLRALQLAPSYGVSPEPWRTATHYVAAASAGAPACVAFYPLDGRMPFDYYLTAGAAPAAQRLTPVLPARPWSSVHPYVEQYAVPSAAGLATIAGRCPRLWLIASHQGQRDGPPGSRIDYIKYRALNAMLAHLYPRRHSRSFGWAAVITATRFSRW